MKTHLLLSDTTAHRMYHDKYFTEVYQIGHVQKCSIEQAEYVVFAIPRREEWERSYETCSTNPEYRFQEVSFPPPWGNQEAFKASYRHYILMQWPLDVSVSPLPISIDLERATYVKVV